jgi:hypothetical protein
VVGGPQSPSGLCGEVRTFYPTGLTLKKGEKPFKMVCFDEVEFAWN